MNKRNRKNCIGIGIDINRIQKHTYHNHPSSLQFYNSTIIMSQKSKDKVASVGTRARSTSMDLNQIATELDKIITTLPTTKDQALFKETTLSKPLRYVKSSGLNNSKPLPQLTKKEKQIELNALTVESLDLKHAFKGGKDEERRAHVTVILSKFLQCLLWDFGFRFTLLPHQFEAVYAIAGIKVSVLKDELMSWDDKMLSSIVKIDTRKEEGKKARREVCEKHVSFTRNRGLLLADCMGLGKTVESLAAALLRNGIYSIKVESQVGSDGTADTSKYILPTLIIAPNEAILNQWEENLIMSGIDPDNIKYFTCSDKNLFRHEEDYILMTRHSLMVEVRKLLNDDTCNIFPKVPEETLKCLKDVVGKHDKGYSESVKTAQITKILGANMGLQTFKGFRSLIIDEAHMMKNLTTYWGVGAGLLSAMSQRNIPISGTPFIHGTQDMATLMVYIDSSLPQAQKYWWTGATSPYSPGEEVIKDVKEWRKSYFVRRKKSVLTKELPTKTIQVKNVGCVPSEMTVYNEHERAYFDALSAYLKMSEGFEDKRELSNFLFAQLTCMRMSIIHPLLTKGREFTIKFSPSRRNKTQLTKDVSKVCVCCKMGAIPSNDASCNGNENKLVPVPTSLCHAANSTCPHYIHMNCLKLLEEKGIDRCPRCREFENLAQIDSKLAYKIPYPTYSGDVFVAHGMTGFKATSKIQQVIEWVRSIPEEDKGIIYSFFEGSLDLLEGIFVENLNIECARFDDDVDPENQAIELSRFKKSPTCNLLLATVQSSGTGLNIEEANHIAFLDRCFDTSVHRQAEDRCHNLRQKKEVEVTYFDASMTVDEIMNTLNVQTSSSDTVRLVDGTEVGKKEPTIKYDNLSGEIRRMLDAVKRERKIHLEQNPENAFIPCKADLIEAGKEKENVPVLDVRSTVPRPQSLKPQALGDASNKTRRVSFASPASNQHLPPVTPTRLPTAQTHNTPSAFNYMTATQSPFSPSFNYAAYHGYGSAVPRNIQGIPHGFAAVASPQFNRRYYAYPNPLAQVVQSSIPVYNSTQNVAPAQGVQSSIPIYNNNNPQHPAPATKQYSNIVNSKKQKRKQTK